MAFSYWIDYIPEMSDNLFLLSFGFMVLKDFPLFFLGLYLLGEGFAVVGERLRNP